MKKRLLIGKIIGFIGIIIFAMGISYVITFYSERKKYQDINLLVTFEDTKTFKIEKLQDKELTLKTYPYKFTIKNKNKSNISYKIKIKDVNLDIKRNDLNYVLLKNDKQVKEDSFKNLNNNYLYTDKISSKEEIEYALYIYSFNEGTYEYSLEIETNK